MKFLSNQEYELLQDRITNLSTDNFRLERLASDRMYEIIGLKAELNTLRSRMTEVNLKVALETGREVVSVPEKIIPARVEPAHIQIRKVRK